MGEFILFMDSESLAEETQGQGCHRHPEPGCEPVLLCRLREGEFSGMPGGGDEFVEHLDGNPEAGAAQQLPGDRPFSLRLDGFVCGMDEDIRINEGVHRIFPPWSWGRVARFAFCR